MLAVTCGDPCGIGPDIVIDAWLRRDQYPVPPFCLFGDCEVLLDRAKLLGKQIQVIETDMRQAVSRFSQAIPVVPLHNRFTVTPGVPHSGNAAGILESIERAVDAVQGNNARAVVTSPISKKTLYDAGFVFPGHTEYLAALCSKKGTAPVQPVMMLAGPGLRVVPVTVHIPLAEVPDQLSFDLVVTTARITANALAEQFGISGPRLAMAGLNPHAGEGGALGKQDDEIIRPAVEALRSSGLHVTGPLPADTMFHPAARAQYDAAICMYHDQALIPVKALYFDDAVNVTLGLPFIRTSPDHGTAFDIVGSGLANAGSLVAALNLAQQLGITGTTPR